MLYNNEKNVISFIGKENKQNVVILSILKALITSWINFFTYCLQIFYTNKKQFEIQTKI